MTQSQTRIQSRFAQLKREGQTGFVAFITGGDPDYETSLALLKGLSDKGVDIIELGMPFSDPMADGPSIQRASLRALQGGQTLARTLDLVGEFRAYDAETPIVLMGYFNPIYQFGVEAFLKRCESVGVDGLIVVDLPSEADDELCLPAKAAGLDFIRLITPTTDEARLKHILEHASGFLYYVSITGVTGTAAPSQDNVGLAIRAIRQATDLPVAIGFGIRSPDQARNMALLGDAVVVGSALVDEIERGLKNGQSSAGILEQTLAKVSDLVEATHKARKV